MNYQFSITINNQAHKLTPKNGLSLCEFGSLLCDLYGATDPGDGSKCVLYGISNHGYTSNFVTESERLYEKYLAVHRHIHERGLEDLSVKEAKYARTLKHMLRGGLYLQPYDKDAQLIATINPNEIKQTVQGYFSVTTIYGVIAEMGSPSLSKGTHVFLDGSDYKIFTSKAQDAELRQYYRGGQLAFKVRQKRSLANDKVINATLISFKTFNNLSLSDSIATLTDEDLGFLNGVNNQEDLLELLGK